MFDGLGGAIVAGLVLALVIGATLGGAAFWLLPKLWAWLKPIIHAATG